MHNLKKTKNWGKSPEKFSFLGFGLEKTRNTLLAFDQLHLFLFDRWSYFDFFTRLRIFFVLFCVKEVHFGQFISSNFDVEFFSNFGM